MISKQRIAIIGAGGFGREVFHLLVDGPFECVGFIDYDKPQKGFPMPIIGNESDMERLMDEYEFSNCALAIGDIEKRKNIQTVIKELPIRFPSVIHSSVQSFSKDIQNGTILYPGVIIMNDCRIGKFTLLNTGVALGHDVVIGDFCNINPGVYLAGKITIGDNSFIGIGSSIKEKVTIGKNVIVGAGSVVINDVSDNTTVYGVPARAASL